MPLHKVIYLSNNAKLYLWKITEELEVLSKDVLLKDSSIKRLESMKSESHRKGFLAVRKLLEHLEYSDFDLYYDEFGKPHFIDEKQISITHSHHFSAIIVSNEAIGIDIEMQRDIILKIAHKFVNDEELERLQKTDLNDYIKKLTVKWGAKEAIFKIKNEKGISFRNHIQVAPFELNQTQTTADLNFNGAEQKFNIHFSELDTNFTLVYAFENNDTIQEH